MKVLLRSYKGEQYVWKKAEMKNTFQFTLEDGRDVNQTQIVSISRDNRKRFVMCSACCQILFTKYPGVFDDMITVDKILDNGFTERINYPSRGLVEYKLKGKNNITAVVNRLNIVDYFEISYRNYTIDVVYSKKYEMMFSISSGMYREFNWSQCIPDKTLKSIKEKIASLYN